MGSKQADQVRALSDEKLKEEEGDTQRELLNLRFKLATRQLANVNELRIAKRQFARIRTIARERELAGGK